jgi:hypothetical protein
MGHPQVYCAENWGGLRRNGEITVGPSRPQKRHRRRSASDGISPANGRELVFAASGMLSGDQHYAGSALVRQVVEIEYLTWTFKEGHASVNAWYNSTHKERMEVFAPRQLRENAKGRFLSKDYADHCEQGGHPTPRGIHFLGGKNPGGAQVMLVDLLTHSWRTWDQVFVWLLRFVETNIIKMPRTALAIKPRLGKWGEHDPLYALMVETYPEPNR